MLGLKVLIFLALAVATISSTVLKDYRLAACPDNRKPCKEPGPLCETCTSLVTCIRNPDGNFTIIPDETCPSGQKCIESQKACSSDPDPVCDGTACLPYICSSVGVFPDPFDCTKYIFCVPNPPSRDPKAYQVDCDPGYKYNIETKVCDLPLDTNDGCPSPPVKTCENAGDIIVLEEDPSIYCICQVYSNNNKVLYPFCYACPNGYQFQNFECKEPGIVTSTVTTPVTTSVTTPVTTTVTIPVTTPPATEPTTVPID